MLELSTGTTAARQPCAVRGLAVQDMSAFDRVGGVGTVPSDPPVTAVFAPQYLISFYRPRPHVGEEASRRATLQLAAHWRLIVITPYGKAFCNLFARHYLSVLTGRPSDGISLCDARLR
jgi:hypothetical protein